MKENSRIRFNPVTGEIEVEGSERFVKAYFQKLQELRDGAPAKKREPAQPRMKKARGVKRAKAKKVVGRKKGTRVTQEDAVVSLVRGSEGGISTAALKAKTGLSERQIWSIVYRAQKQGKIMKTKRGIYTAA